MQIEERELQAEAERLEREMELEKAREAERQKKLDEAAAKQQARLREIEEKEVRLHLVTVAIVSAAKGSLFTCHCSFSCCMFHKLQCLQPLYQFALSSLA